MPVLHSYVRSGVLLPPIVSGYKVRRGQAPTLRCRFCGGSVFGIPATDPRMPHWACSERRILRWKAVPKHVCIFLKTDLLEDLLCAPGSPLLRSKEAVWY